MEFRWQYVFPAKKRSVDSPQDAPGEISLAPVSTQENRVLLYIKKTAKNQPQLSRGKYHKNPVLMIWDMGWAMWDLPCRIPYRGSAECGILQGEGWGIGQRAHRA